MLNPTWHKSSYSTGGDANCVEVAATWNTSSYSQGDGNCVEVADAPETVKIRDTKHRHLGHLEFDPRAWTVFVAEIKQGRM